MGVNTHVYLPSDVRLRDVGEAIGILAGLPFSFLKFGHGPSGYIHVEGVSYEVNEHTPSMVNIEFAGQMVDGQTCHSAYYHFENPDGSRCVSLKSTSFWIAVGIGLAKFFGGKVSFSDCNGGTNRRYKKPRTGNSPEDGRPWDNFQKAMMKIKPLTKKDLDAVRKFAAYPEA